MVPQQAVLFRGTIRENMRWGNPEATDEDIWRALAIAQARDFVEAREGGLDAIIEQGGRNLFRRSASAPDHRPRAGARGADTHPRR